MHMHSLTKSWFMPLCVLFLAGCNHVDEITPRSYVGIAVGHTGRLKLEIAKSLLANPGKPVPLAGELQLPPPPGLNPVKFEFGWVTAGGAIIIHSKEYSVTVLQEPRVDQGQVKWSCVVRPADAKPNVCGDQ
ncbi:MULTISPECIES: hypothetical protein [unclassified Polaromonas]|uniref:hypothetical protein n=1 Tax=unclassified Polaromonas TaxID=2638319 RepID=UPI00129E4FCF|nr:MULTISPECIES: hypothetical protein [unclassified Polaromonas]QGJ17682.1 hypothetical protein F7R28_04260 [Polaromonas sp. Pch-P]